MTSLLSSLAPLLSQEPAVPTDARGWIQKGTQEFQRFQYQEAAASFQKAVDLIPSDVTARLSLAGALISEHFKQPDSSENSALADQAVLQLRTVLEIDPNNRTALSSLGSLRYQQAQRTSDAALKIRELGESGAWYQKLIAATEQGGVFKMR